MNFPEKKPSKWQNMKNYEKAIEFVFLCKKQLILNSGITS